MIVCLVANVIAVSTLNTAARCKLSPTIHVRIGRNVARIELSRWHHRCCHDADAWVVLFGLDHSLVMGCRLYLTALYQAGIRHCAD